MQKLSTTLFLVSLFTIFPFGGLDAQALTLNYFTAVPSGTDVMVSWELPSEAGVTKFSLSRKVDTETEFSNLTEINPTGSLTYEYLDYSLFKDSPKLVTYKLQINKSGMVYSYYATVLYNPTSVQRTWGSIKAMFR